MSGDGLVPPLNAPPAGQPQPGVQPGVSGQIVVANKVIVFGPGGGIFVYNGTPALGNPPIFYVTTGAADPYGNPVTPLAATSRGATQAIQLLNGIITFLFSSQQVGSLAASGPGLMSLFSLGSTAAGNTGWSLFSNTAAGGPAMVEQTGPLSSIIFTLGPSGDNTGATDVANINNALAGTGYGYPAGGAYIVRLMPGDYFINAPIVIPGSQVRLTGDWWWSASVNDNYSAGVGASGGAVIHMVPAFAGLAAITMINSTVGKQFYGVDISGITIEGFAVPAGTIYGIYVDGAWGACFLRGVCIHRPPADCIRFLTDVTTGKIPDDWLITACKFSASRNGYGVFAQDLADSWISDCESSENALDGWYINYGIGTRFTACKGENNGGAGFHLTGLAANQTQWLTGCGTHLNKQDGFLFDNAGPNGGGLGSYVLTGCVAEDDGQTAAAGFAGFRSSGCRSRVILTGCATDVTPAVGPQYGASEVGTSYGMAATGCYLQGVTAATNDDGTNTHALSNLVPVPF